MEIFIPYLHFVSIILLAGALVSEHLFLKPGMNAKEIKKLASIDLIYGIAATSVLITGLLRWFVYGKGSEYYLSNPAFHAKLTLFVIMGIISIIPTLKFLKWRRQVKKGEVPSIENAQIKRLLIFIRIELTILLIIPLLAVMVAMGIGF